MAIPQYQYRVVDKSITTPYFKEWVVAPLFKAIPWWIPANIITVISNLFVYFALFIAIFEVGSPTFRFLVVPLCMLAYAIGDHMDGMQAKRTKTNSALGEFFDHFLDIFNNGILVFTVCALLQVSNTWLIAYFMVSAYLSHAAIFYEQSSTKWLHFEKVGALESVFALVAVLLLSLIPSVHHFFISPLLFSLTFIEIAFILTSAGTIITFCQVVNRAKIKAISFYVFCLFLIIVGWLGSTFLSPISLFAVITLYSGIYIGNLQRGHLADDKKRVTDFIVPAIIVLLYFFDGLRTPFYLNILYCYLGGYILYITVYSLYTLREFWVWSNPKI